MDKKRIIVIGAVIILTFTIIFGLFWVLKNGIPDLRKAADFFQKSKEVPEEEEAVSLAPEEKLSEEEIQKKRAEYEQLSAKLENAKVFCEKPGDIADITKERLAALNKEEENVATAGRLTCEAVQKQDLKKCDFLKDISSDLFSSCVMTAAQIQITRNKCSPQSLSQCRNTGLLTESDCGDMCAVFVENKISGCESLKNEDNLYKGCLAVIKNNVDLCAEISDGAAKKSCVDNYYLNSAVKNSDGSLIDKISSDSSMRFYARAVLDGGFSCQSAFPPLESKSVFDAESCVTKLLGDRKELEEKIIKLKEEMESAERAKEFGL